MTRTKPYGDRRHHHRDAAGCSERARAAAGFRARGVPVLLSAVAGHAVSGGCDGRRGGLASVRFLAASALAARRKDEAEELARSTEEKVQLLAVPRALRTPEQLRRIDELVAESLARSGMRKRKKRKKKKLPRGRARRRQRQRPLSGYGALIVNSGRDMCKAGFSSSRSVPFGCRQAQMLDIMARMEQKNSYVLLYSAPRASWPVWTRRTGMTWCLWSRLLILWVSAVAVLSGRRHPFRSAEVDLHGPGYSADHRDSPVVRIWWSMSLLCGRAGSPLLSV